MGVDFCTSEVAKGESTLVVSTLGVLGHPSVAEEQKMVQDQNLADLEEEDDQISPSTGIIRLWCSVTKCSTCQELSIEYGIEGFLAW